MIPQPEPSPEPEPERRTEPRTAPRTEARTGSSSRPRLPRGPLAAQRDLVVALSPFEEPGPRIVTAAERAGALGLLDLGRDRAAARRAFAELARRLGGGRYGVRVPAGCPVGPGELPAEVDTVLLADPASLAPELVAGWAAAQGEPRVWAEVTDPARALAAVAAGVEALVAKGHEAGGRVGDATTFVLLQQLLADPAIGVPVRAFGGIGPHTAAAAVTGGAAGVLVDVQLALTREGEAGLPAEVAAALRAMDGSETRLVDGHRVYARPDLPRPEGPVETLLGARDLRTQLLPVGQDGASAARLAARHRTTGGVLQGIRAAVTGHLAAAVRARPLGRGHEPGQPLPVAQGPMTRVSDQAAFAEAVAVAAGLPYLALAVMEAPDVRRLLAETGERLGDRPWGVGLLGFAPAELRAEQLAAVVEARPPYAIIAGGTPAQAAPLEAAGIRTHLHVPSPGLLERYLADGARRFVFEGLECGGHVGPRASFPLWEEQIEILLSCREPAALDVLFAGGIHDERSAAMAVAAAAPLADRGARIGVLMGTAYLFTEEAVAAGAVLPVFQRAAVECTDTVLLHTAPGHATRCAGTPYVDTFGAARRRLTESGVEPRAMWAELERLNLGRLRIASKGLRRGAAGGAGGSGSPGGSGGAGLEQVDEEQQYAEGLFMLGQAATLRSAITTVAALHAQVTEGATEFLRLRAEEVGAAPQEARAPGPLDIAVVGMACAYPGAPDLASYWAGILAGNDAVTEVPAERWDPALHFDPDPARAGERTPSRWGGFLGPMPFDALAYGIPPASLTGIEPVQLLALEVSARALADAGYGKGREFDRSRTSVVFGAEAGTELAGAYGLRALYPGYLGALPPELDAQLPRLTEDSFPGVLANVIAGRVANRLDLGGANCTVDAACASSLAALDLACRQLRDGDSDMALCGGADVHNGINDYLLFSSVRALSPGGRCRPFDAAADGIALGEGVGALVLKRLADAERDGDRVYAVIKAVGASSDGRSLGLTAPRPQGQRAALERAYARAGVSPAEVGLVEAHGTGTTVGDSTELAVLSELFTASGASPGSCALGSVKSQIGHTKCAAGLAGLIKAARAVHAGVRPPTRNLDMPVPAWQPETSPFFFDTEARPWAAPPERRIAGVSAFGFGGTNYHAVLAGYAGAEEPRHGLEEWPAELFCFRGADRRAAGRAMARLAARLEENDAAGRPWALRDLAAEVADGSGPVLVSVVARDRDELAIRLKEARAFAPGAGVHVREESADPGRVAFLFPGQGSQRPGMSGELFMAFPALRELLDTAPGAVVSAMFPPTAFTARGRAAQRAAVTDTRVAQPALGLAGSAAHLLLGTLGVRPDCVAGHSYGELTALWAAGVWDTGSLLRLSARRAEAIVAAAGTDPGSMAAVAAAPDAVREIAERAGCVVANHNAPRQCVISGPSGAVSEAVAGLREAGLSAQPLPVACAFHSGVVAGARVALAEELAGTAMADAAVPVWSNTTAGPYPASAEDVRGLVARQVAEPVRFVEQVENMYAAGVRTFVEAGPGRVLSGLVGRILQGRPHTAVPLDVPGEHGLVRLVTALAELTAAGVSVTPQALFRGRTSRLPAHAPRRPGWLVDGHLVRTADGHPLPGGLHPARRVRIPAVAAGPGPAAGGAPGPAPASAAILTAGPAALSAAGSAAGPTASLAAGSAAGSAASLAAGSAAGSAASAVWLNDRQGPAMNGVSASDGLHPAHWAALSAPADPVAATPMAAGAGPTPLAGRPNGHRVPAVGGPWAATAGLRTTTAESIGGPQMSPATSAAPAGSTEPLEHQAPGRANSHPVQAAGGGPAGGPWPPAGPAVGRSDGQPAQTSYGGPGAGGHQPFAADGTAGSSGTRSPGIDGHLHAGLATHPGQAEGWAQGRPAGHGHPDAGLATGPGWAEGQTAGAQAPAPAGDPGTRASGGQGRPYPGLAPGIGQAAGWVEGQPAGAQAPAPAAGAFLSAATDSRAAVLLEYLRGSRDLVQAQRDVLLGYLGSAAQTDARTWASAEPVAYFVGQTTESADQARALPGGTPEFGDQGQGWGQGQYLAAPHHSSAAPAPALGAVWPGAPGATSQGSDAEATATGPQLAEARGAAATGPWLSGPWDAASAVAPADGPDPDRGSPSQHEATAGAGLGEHRGAANATHAFAPGVAPAPEAFGGTDGWSSLRTANGSTPPTADSPVPAQAGHGPATPGPWPPAAVDAALAAEASGPSNGWSPLGTANGSPAPMADSPVPPETGQGFAAPGPGPTVPSNAAPAPEAFGRSGDWSPLGTANGSPLLTADSPVPTDAGHSPAAPGPWPSAAGDAAPAPGAFGWSPPGSADGSPPLTADSPVPAQAGHGPATPGPWPSAPVGAVPGSGAADSGSPGGVPADPAAAPAGGGARSAEEVMDVIVEIVHTRTGYPRDMLDPDLDLEADLSVDSIKRVEIIGALADRIGLPQDPGGSAESAIEELSRIKTLRGIVDWVTAHTAPPASAAQVIAPATAPGATPGTAPAGAPSATPGAASGERADAIPATPATPATAPGTASATSPGAPSGAAPATSLGTAPGTTPATAPGATPGTASGGQAAAAPAPARGAAPSGRVAAATLTRLRVDLLPLPQAAGSPETLRGLRIGIVGDGFGDGPADGETVTGGTATDGPAVVPALTAALRAHGADVRQLDAPEAGFDGVLDLSGLRPGAVPVLPEAFPALQRTLTGGVRRLLLVTGNGGAPGAGLHGFARSAALEFPGRLIRAVDVHPKEDPERIAAQLVAELSDITAELAGASGAAADPGPASVGYTAQGGRVTRRPVPAPLGPAEVRPALGPDSVVLLTGGARGITARTALALARATGCHVELMGRTPQPPSEADEFGTATDRAALRAALIATGLRTPAEIEAAASRILAEREVRDTLSALATVAASVRYHCADVTDGPAVRAVVAGVRERHGRLDGIVHGAGTLRDGLLRDKQPAAFAEVFTTKVTGARHLALAAAEHGTSPAPRFLALFGSVAGVYGNRGQTDYAAANDALDCLAHTWAESFPGRVLSVDWGPWAAEAGGMVSPELARAYSRRGIPLIEPEAGTAAFLAELSHGSDVQVVLMAEGSGDGGERG
ncbi:hypothetical protein SAVIM338S_06533 [Streptomyces avidinii]